MGGTLSLTKNIVKDIRVVGVADGTALLYSNTRSTHGAAMFADADHETIDSPEALFRHLYEEHGVTEAIDLDPETAPVQFWLRRHVELERAQRATRHADPAPPPDPPAGPEPVARPRPEPQPPAGPDPAARPRPEPDPPRAPGPRRQREGRRPARFGDPLLEAMTRALVGRGQDEAAVRAAIRSFPAGGGQPAGEAGVRAAFVEPMLQAVTEHLLAPAGPRHPRPADPARPASDPAPAAADPAPPREEGGRPEAAWAVLWADLAEEGRRAGEGAGAAGEEGDDLMAVANAVQSRRRVRLLRR
jgi:hypothetical protein